MLTAATNTVVLIPVLGRPHRVRAVLDAFTGTARGARVLFIANPDDQLELDAIAAAGGELLMVDGNYAVKVNTAIRAVTEPLVFLAADDLKPRPGWLPAARGLLDGQVQVVGVNDLIPRRPGRERHATHFLMTRQYALQPTIDGARGPLHEGYTHSFVDDELIATARHRGVYAYAAGSHVEHLHPMTGGAPDDETYRLGRRHFKHDRRLHANRSPLWEASCLA